MADRPFRNRQLKPSVVKGIQLLNQAITIAKAGADHLQPKWLDDITSYWKHLDDRLQRVRNSPIKKEGEAQQRQIRDYINDPVLYTNEVNVDALKAELDKVTEVNHNEVCDGLYRGLRFLRNCQSAASPNGMIAHDYDDWSDIKREALEEIKMLRAITPERETIYLGDAVTS